ncbi:MAG: septum formation protein Maf [Citromicrobium sp.]|nr:septum formation protein Maf [Citromicrobium sp.]MAO94831.1 septum formation protein Maf [Citromicrobium sp.]MAS86242.1 septum formation protein Maf [Erythrobacteraceae bacterium]MBT46750.1 septum formation protein Maf [Citromicrobium sp.]
MTPRLILASSSPRRRDLLAQIGVIPDDIRSPDIDEVPRKGELPRPYAERMASEKALAVPRSQDEVILAGDTTVAVGRRILPQAASEADVTRFLRLLSGRRHRVYSCISVIDASGTQRTRCAASQVRFKQLSDEEIAAYAAGGEGIGKAGGYAIQGRAAGLIDFLSGSHSGVVGLPLFETRALLKAAGIALG